jgi:hypothetical protein
MIARMDDNLGAPNCPRCLAAMEVVEIAELVAWFCPECELVRL